MRRKKRGLTEPAKAAAEGTVFTADPNHYQAYEFAPRQPLDGKNNVGRNIFVELDGSVKEVIRLNILDDRHREDIIAYHFCMQYAEICYGDDPNRPEFYAIGRDDPWDYRYVMHDGSRFNVEICRVASSKFLKMMKIENDCSLLLMRDFVVGHQVRKIERHFPGTFSSEIAEAAAKPSAKNERFSTHGLYSASRAFLRPSFDPYVDVKAALNESIQKKLMKRNLEKDETHLILDNLTTHATAAEFFNAYGDIDETLEAMPFLSIWLYTGYYSDDNGDNCEFALMPIKIGIELEKKFESFLQMPGC